MKITCLARMVLLGCSLASLTGAQSERSDESVYRNAELGVAFRAPAGVWSQTSGSSGSSEHVLLESREEPRTQISLQIWKDAPRDRSLTEWCELELRYGHTTERIEEIRGDERSVAGRPARATRYRRGQGGTERLVDVTYLARDGGAYRIAVAVPPESEGRLDGLVDETLAGISWTRPEAPKPAALEIAPPITGNVLTVVRAGADSPRRFLEALPGAARSNEGLPIVLVVGDRLTESARAFLEKYRPERIRIVGEPHPELPRAEKAEDEWGSDGAVVVTTRELEDAVPAAAMATRWGVPLLVEGPDLEARLRALRPAQVVIAGPVEPLPTDLPVEPIGDAIARRSSSGRYIALCNVAEGHGQETAVFAAALAAVHEGVVLPIAERVRLHRAPLLPTRDAPSGLVSELGRYVTGTLPVDGRPVRVAAPVIGQLRIAGIESDRFGRPRIDLDGDGRFEETEEHRIGETVRLGEDTYAFSVRYRTALGHPERGEALFLEPDPQDIRRSIRTFVERLGGADHLAIVGTPDRIPFALRESEAYFSSLDIKQEVASDAPYADLDDDRSLELAVGRILTPDLETGSAVLATSLAYARFEGEWLQRASLIAPGYAGSESRGSLHWVWPESESLARGIAADLASVGIRADAFLRDEGARLEDVLASMAGAGWIAHMNHSNETAWGILPGVHLRTDDLPALAGAPIVFDTGCTSAGIDLGTPLQQTWPGRFFTLGAVAYLGNTRPATLGTEVALKEMFNRLIAGGETLGEAYRDGWNLFAHLLDQGLIDPELGSWTFDPGLYDRLEAQLYNVNLFGDPALEPRLPRPLPEPFVDVRLEETEAPDRLRLTIERDGAERVDPILMLAASGRGEPREALLRSAPGLTYARVPHFYLEHGRLDPLRSPLAVGPGVWVDVALPSGGESVRVEQVEGAPWSDRGFTIERDPGGPARLRMYVPLVHATLEEGAGESLSRVVFDIALSGARGAPPAPTRSSAAMGSVSQESWPIEPPSLEQGTVSGAARPVLEKVRRRLHDPVALSMSRYELSVGFAGGELLKGLRARIVWANGEDPTVEVSGLPTRMLPHREQVTAALGFLPSLIRNDPFGLVRSSAWDVGQAQTGDGGVVLVFERPGEDEGDEHVFVVVSEDGRIERLQRNAFGVEEDVRLEWQETPSGDVLLRQSTADVKYGQPRVVEIEYGETSPGLLLPTRVKVSVPGILPGAAVFRLERIEW